LFQWWHAHYSSFVWGHCCVFKRAHLKTEKKRAANNFLNCRTDRIDNQRLTPALKHDCDKYVVTFSFGCCCWGYSLGLLL
jgi:hypothetical protein